MDKRTKEAIRYLGYGRNAVDERTLSLISDSFCELTGVMVAKSIYRIFHLQIQSEDGFSIGKVNLKSKNLGKNLKGCGQIIVFGATLGTGVDILLKKYSLTDMAKVVVLQACAAAMLEEYCDLIQSEIALKLEKEHKYLRPRFSPGYGDFDISYQDPLMRMIDCAKTIGLTMTDSFMLSPSKSVTAVIGVSNTKEPCHIKGCEVCSKSDCLYRRS